MHFNRPNLVFSFLGPKDEEFLTQGPLAHAPPHLQGIKDPVTSSKTGKPAASWLDGPPMRTNSKKSNDDDRSKVVYRSRTRSKSTSDKGYVAALEKGAECILLSLK